MSHEIYYSKDNIPQLATSAFFLLTVLMPELPEVQTTASGLQSVLPGKIVTNVWTDWPKMFRGDTLAKFKKETAGRKVVSVKRRGKHILINLSGDTTIIIHMKMTGHLLYGKWQIKNKKWVPAQSGPLNDPFNRFVHAVFSLSNGKHLAFSDTRKFGKIVLGKTNTLSHSPHLAHLGPEPLEKSFDYEVFAGRLLKKPRGKIKTVLMDQTVIAGIGNIYSDEMLWRAGIHPETKVGLIKVPDLGKLFIAMKEVLNGGIEFGGDSMSDYRNIFGEKGHFQEKHHAYQKKGERCEKRGCGGIIERKIVGGRSAHFCPKHQNNKR
ncbi:MAG: bifunctional DNA-formamidopyrimidine glycosylase/DNA-(apurinic or apyrimidinic site) lyase [Candidatus Paceibacterota bacterium]|jgi:formamidopyrimidine-DNA glycosylase